MTAKEGLWVGSRSQQSVINCETGGGTLGMGGCEPSRISVAAVIKSFPS